MSPRLKSICHSQVRSALSGTQRGDGWLRRWGWGLAHGVQADVADGMVLSAGWLLHDEHPLTVPCAHQHSSSISPTAEPQCSQQLTTRILAAEPQDRRWRCGGSQASELRDIQRGGEDAAYRKASGATTLSYSVPVTRPHHRNRVSAWSTLAHRLARAQTAKELREL